MFPPDVRLADGLTSTEGRVEALHNGKWGTVCDNGWDINDARVVCRSLGFTDASSATSAAEFGPGSGDVIVDNVRCFGSESSIWECPHGELWANNCSHSRDAGVRCQGQKVFELTYLLYLFVSHIQHTYI